MKLSIFSAKKSFKPMYCDVCLIVYNQTLLHIEHKHLIAQPDESLFKLTATELAEATRRLLPNLDKRYKIALALPNSEFVTTTLVLPAIAEQNLKNAVLLQQLTLLPGTTEPLLVAVQPQLQGETTSAIWMSVKRAEEIYQAFDKQGLFLTHLIPRALLALTSPTNSCQVYDEDEETITCFEWTGKAIKRWLQVPKVDLQQPEFHLQWEKSLESLKNEIEQQTRNNLEDWKSVAMPNKTIYGYAFTPPSTTAKLLKVTQRRKKRALQVIAVLLMIAFGAGVMTVFNYEQQLEKRLARIKNRTVDVRKLQSEVLKIEDHIAPVRDFPEQQVIEVLSRLNQLIPKDSWITHFQIETGVVKIEGYSPNPAELIGILLTEPRFTEVAPSQATQLEGGKRNRFGISFKLQGVNFKEYWLQHFPIER